MASNRPAPSSTPGVLDDGDADPPLDRTPVGPTASTAARPAASPTVDAVAADDPSIERAAATRSSATSLDAAPTFDDLYRDEYDSMVRVAYLLVGDAATAEELVQDAFIRVHLRWDRIDAPAAFLRTCVVNACRDRLRRRVRFRSRVPRLEAQAAADALDGGSSAGPAAELHDVLLRLPLRQRTAIVGRFYCGWDDPTIAAVIGVRPGTVRTLVHRGLAALRTELPR